MSRQMRRAKVNGFKAGNIPFRETPLKDVILVGQRTYQVKARDSRGQIQSLYPRTWYRNNLILVRFHIWRVGFRIRRFFSGTLSRVFPIDE